MNVTKGIAVVLAATILASGGGTAATLATAQPAQASSTQTEIDTAIQQILTETNAERANAGLEPLILTPSISRVAQSWTQQMAAKQSMTHNPGYSDGFPKPWLRAGENVGQGYTTSTIVAAWMASEGHRKNILGDFTHIGLGYWVDDFGRAWFTQNFAKYEIPKVTEIADPTISVDKHSFSASWQPKWDETMTDWIVELYSPEGSLLKTETTTTPSVTYTGLTANTGYVLKVIARDFDAPGYAFTSPVRSFNVTTLEDLPEVSAPTNLTLTSSENTVTAEWAAPATTNGTLQPYKVELKNGPTVIKTVETTSLSQVFTGLTSNTDYSVTVTAQTVLNGKTATAVATQTTKTALSSAAEVSEPTNFAVTSNSASVTATWGEPATKVGNGLKYKLTLSTEGKPDTVIETTALSHTFTGLTSDTPYTLKVQATIVAENGVNSSTTTGVSTSVRTLVNNGAVSVTAPTLQPVQVEAKQATLNWTAPESVTGKLVDYTVTVKQTGKAERVFNTTEETFVVTGLLENTAYTFEVKANAVSLDGANNASASSTPQTHTTPYASDTVIVSAPRLLTVKAASDSEITASWTAPSTVVGDLTGYKATLKNGGTVVSTKTVTALNASFTGLNDNTNYTVEVTALASSPDKTKTAGSTTVSASAFTPVSVAAPNAPRTFVANAVTYNSANLSWTAPTGVVGTVTGYTLTVKQAGKADRVIQVTGNSYSLTGLDVSTSYIIQVAAKVTSKDGSKTATSPSASVSFKTGLPFKDMASTDFVKEITWMKSQKISTGYGDGTYRPLGVVTREQMAAFMYRMAGYPAFTPPAVSPFKDVPTSHVFYKEITWMRSSGISTGWADRTFRPYENVSRESMSAFMHRYAAKVCSVNVTASKYFKDANRSVFASDIAWMGGVGVSTGWADGTYRPFDAVTREAMSAFMYRLNNHVNANGGCK